MQNLLRRRLGQTVGYKKCLTLKQKTMDHILSGSFSFRHILPTEIMQVISAQNVGCFPGPYGLEAKFRKLASQVLIFPLANLFNLSLSTCKLPSIRKFAKVTPLHKGDPLDLNNYRLISIICTTAKIFEKLIF